MIKQQHWFLLAFGLIAYVLMGAMVVVPLLILLFLYKHPPKFTK